MNNFVSQVTWQVSVSDSSDTSDFQAFLDDETDVEVEIPSEYLVDDVEYTFTATTDNDRNAEASLTYEASSDEEEEEEDIDNDDFIELEENDEYQISYRFTKEDGSKAEEQDEADSI